MVDTILAYLNGINSDVDEDEINRCIWDICQDTQRKLVNLNNSYHTDTEIPVLMSELIGEKVGEGFRMFLPFYADFGRNVHIGKNVFINSGCHFQDQGGIYISDNALIGHNVVLATINHALAPHDRRNLYAPIHIGENVWIGSNATILQGVTIGDGSVIGAGSVVTKSIPENSIAVGVPAKVIRKIEE